jgi:hypothetical protein
VIPGSKPKIEPTAKVRIGVKRTSGNGREYPAAVDYFVCEHPAFAELVGDKPKTLRIRFVHSSIDDAFSTGLEWWVKKSGKKPTLACYTKDGGENPVALRLDQMLDPGQEAVGPPRGSGRLPILCPARECVHFTKGDCKPMGRLVFQVEGSQHVWQIDTKAWNSIERLEGTLRLAQGTGPLDAPGRLFDLSVEMVKKGRDQFPVLSIKEVEVLVNSPADAGKADALLALDATLSAEGLADREGSLRAALAAALDHVKPGWRDNPAVIEAIKAKGVEASARGLLEKNL